MKRIFLILLALSGSVVLFSQNENPFKQFGYDVLVASSSKGEFQEFHDQTDIVEIGSVLFNTQTNEIVKVLEKDETTIDISSATTAMSIDPLCEKYYWISPYVYCANNPVRYIDPTGLSHSEFDENGNYLRTTKDNWFHNTFFGRTGRIIDSEGNVTQKFKFADPKNDVNDLKSGAINKVHFVQESEITSMLSKAGAFTEENKVANSDSRYGYISEEGKGGGKFDFSYTGIPNQYPEASSNPLNQPSSMLFLVDGVAHNQMNYGNFLFGAAGRALGLTSFELRMGAHYNSVFNSSTNGYKPQLDSRDDQFSIRMGVRHANKHGYKNMYYRVTVGPLQKH